MLSKLSTPYLFSGLGFGIVDTLKIIQPTMQDRVEAKPNPIPK